MKQGEKQNMIDPEALKSAVIGLVVTIMSVVLTDIVLIEALVLYIAVFLTAHFIMPYGRH